MISAAAPVRSRNFSGSKKQTQSYSPPSITFSLRLLLDRQVYIIVRLAVPWLLVVKLGLPKTCLRDETALMQGTRALIAAEASSHCHVELRDASCSARGSADAPSPFCSFPHAYDCTFAGKHLLLHETSIVVCAFDCLFVFSNPPSRLVVRRAPMIQQDTSAS